MTKWLYHQGMDPTLCRLYKHLFKNSKEEKLTHITRI